MTDLDRNWGPRWFEEVWNQGRRETIAEMMGPDAVLHDGGIDTVGPREFQAFYDRIQSSISEIHISVEDSIAERDLVCVRWTCTGKHTGHGLGMAPTGRVINITGITIVRVADGKLLEAWQNWDMLGMMEQIQGAAKSGTYIGA